MPALPEDGRAADELPTGGPASAQDRDDSTVQELTGEVAGLRLALDSRDIIGQAKGVTRVLLRCDAQEAFDLLADLSQGTNRRLRDLAVLVVDCAATGQPLPQDLAVIWNRRTATPVVGQPATNAPGPAAAG